MHCFGLYLLQHLILQSLLYNSRSVSVCTQNSALFHDPTLDLQFFLRHKTSVSLSVCRLDYKRKIAMEGLLFSLTSRIIYIIKTDTTSFDSNLKIKE